MIKVFIDMDSVIADFVNAPALNGAKNRGYGNYPEMYEVGFFEDLPVIPGALSTVREIIKLFGIENTYILTQPVKETHYSYSEKAAWIAKWFPELSNNLILTQHKGLEAAPGRVLIDDNAEKWKNKWEGGGGTFVWFNTAIDPRREWSQILSELQELRAADQERLLVADIEINRIHQDMELQKEQ